MRFPATELPARCRRAIVGVMVLLYLGAGVAMGCEKTTRWHRHPNQWDAFGIVVAVIVVYVLSLIAVHL